MQAVRLPPAVSMPASVLCRWSHSILMKAYGSSPGVNPWSSPKHTLYEAICDGQTPWHPDQHRLFFLPEQEIKGLTFTPHRNGPPYTCDLTIESSAMANGQHVALAAGSPENVYTTKKRPDMNRCWNVTSVRKTISKRSKRTGSDC